MAQITFDERHEFKFAKYAYSVQETAEILGIGRTNLYGLVSQGRISPVKCGRRTLFPAQEIAAFIAALEAGRGQ